MTKIRQNIGFCKECGFFADKKESSNGLCSICNDFKRNLSQICLVEKPTDIISVEKSESYFGKYHVLTNLISPLENIFVENTNIGLIFDKRIPDLLKKNVDKIELIIFFKAGFSSEATIAYIKERIKENNYENIVSISRLAQGLPLYYNPDTLDSATMTLAISDRKSI
jgi:recombination protein RecR